MSTEQYPNGAILRQHQRGLFATMVVQLLTWQCPILALSRSVHRFHRARRGDSEGL